MGDNIDSLKFDVILNGEQFKKEAKTIQELAEKFEKSVASSLAITHLLEGALGGVAKVEKGIANAENDIVDAMEEELDATEETKKKKEKIYNLETLREKRAEEMGNLTRKEASVLQQMESLEKSLVSIDEQFNSELAEGFRQMMEIDGITERQLKSYKTLVTQMQAATTETAKREAIEKASQMMREQKETAILNLKKLVAGIDQQILTSETQIAIQKGLAGELTAKEIRALQTTIGTETRRASLEKKNKAEIKAYDDAILALRTQLIGIDRAILSEETRQKIEAAETNKLTKDEINSLQRQITYEKKLADEANRRAGGEANVAKNIQLTTNQLLKQSSVMKGIASMASMYFSVFGAVNIVRRLVEITGEFEAQHTALRAILQDVSAADNIFNQLQTLAVKSPFTFKNLVGYAKQLTAFSVPVNEVYETTKKLADVSAGLGVDMGRIILAYGQVRSAEFLRGTEVRQFTEAGIPILKELADQIQEIEGHAISVGEVFERISARQIPFAMVEEAFNRMTSAGGKFYNMQEVLAETVKGKVSNLQDAWEIMLSKIGNEHSGTIKGIVNSLTDLLQHYDRWIGLLGFVIKYIGIYSASMLVLNTITKTANAIQLLRNGYMVIANQQVKLSTILLPTNIALQKLSIRSAQEEAAALAMLNLARKAAAGLLAALGAALWAVVQHSRRSSEEARKTTDTINAALSKLSITMADFKIGADKVDAAFVKMKKAEGDATEETKAFNKSVDDLKKQFPKFIDDNVKLASSVDELGKYWARARLEMNQYFADEAREGLRNDLQKNRDESVMSVQKDFTRQLQKMMSDANWKASGKNYTTAIWRYITGDISKEEAIPLIDALRISIWGEDANAELNNTLLEKFDKYIERYQEVISNYNTALTDADKAIAEHGLSTTRKTLNDYIATITSDESLLIGADQSVDNFADALRERYASPATSEAIKTAIKTLFDQFPKVLGEVSLEMTGWRKDVNDIIGNFGDTLRTALKATGEMTDEEIEEFVAKNKGIAEKYKISQTDTLAELVDKWIKDLNETEKSIKVLPEKYANLENDAYKGLWLHKLLMETISVGLYGEGNTTFNGNTKDAKGTRKRIIADLKQEFQDLKELKAAYDEYKDLGYSDGDISIKLERFFNRGIPEGGVNAAFVTLADKMEMYNKNDAQDIRNYVEKKNYKEDIKAEQDWRKAFVANIKQQFEDLKELKTAVSEFSSAGYSDNWIERTANYLFGRGVPKDNDFGSEFLDLAKRVQEFDPKLAQTIRDYAAGKNDWRSLVDKAKDRNKQRVDALKQQFQDLKELKAAYDKFKELGFSEVRIDELLKNYFGTGIPQGGFNASFESLASKMEKYSVNDAKDIRNFISGKDWRQFADDVKNAQTAAEKFREEMEKWLAKDFGLEGTDIGYDISKIITQLVTANSTAKITFDKLRKDIDTGKLAYIEKAMASGANKGQAEVLWEIYKAKAFEVIDQIQAKQTAANKKDAQEKVNGLAQKAVKAGLEGKFGTDKILSHWSDKTLGQINDIKTGLQELLEGDVLKNIPQSIKDQATAAGISLDDLIKKIKELLKLDFGNADVEYFKKVSKTSKEIASAASQMGGVISQLGEKLGNTGLEAMGEMLDMAGEFAETIIDGFTEMSKATEGASGAVNDMSQIMNSATVISMAVKVVLLMVKGIVNSINSTRETITVFDALAMKIKSIEKSINSIFGQTPWENITVATQGMNEALKVYESVLKMGAKFYGVSREEFIEGQYEYFKAGESSDGFFGIMTKYFEQYEKFRDAVADLFSDLSAQITDNMVAAFERTGDAAADLEDMFASMGETLVKSIMQSWLLENVLNKYKKEVEDIVGQYAQSSNKDEIWDKTLSDIYDVFGRMGVDIENLAPLFTAMMKGAKETIGSFASESKDAESLSNGIKGITEDTANLMASYLNAIRADVSYGKEQRGRIIALTEGFATQFTTLNDYVAKVQADTHDLALSNREILSNLESMMTSEGGNGPALRTYS